MKFSMLRWRFRFFSTSLTGHLPGRTLGSTIPSHSQPRPLNVLFFGSDNVSLPSLRALDQARSEESPLINDLQVITHAEEKSESPIGRYARERGIPLYQWLNDSTPPSDKVPSLSPSQFSHMDIGVVASFGHLIPASWIESFPLEMINVHPSLLPRYRGAAPISHALLNHDEVTGISIITVDKSRFDHGLILLQKELEIESSDTNVSLERKLADLGASCVLETLANIQTYRANAMNQENSKYSPVSIARKLTAADGNIRWDEWDAREVFGHWRALSHRTYSFHRSRAVKLTALGPVHLDAATIESLQPGECIYLPDSRSIAVRCRQGAIEVKKLQVVGKRELNAFDYARGYGIYPPKNHQLERFVHIDRPADTGTVSPQDNGSLL